jgi:hypothetical protein
VTVYSFKASATVLIVKKLISPCTRKRNLILQQERAIRVVSVPAWPLPDGYCERKNRYPI